MLLGDAAAQLLGDVQAVAELAFLAGLAALPAAGSICSSAELAVEVGACEVDSPTHG